MEQQTWTFLGKPRVFSRLGPGMHFHHELHKGVVLLVNPAPVAAGAAKSFRVYLCTGREPFRWNLPVEGTSIQAALRRLEKQVDYLARAVQQERG